MQASDTTAMATDWTQVARTREPGGKFFTFDKGSRRTHPTNTCERPGIGTYTQHVLVERRRRRGVSCDLH